MRQILFMFFTTTYSSTSYIPMYVARYAKQAALLSPLISFIATFALAIIMGGIYKKNSDNDLSLIDIMYNVFGKPAGKTFAALTGIFVVLYIGLTANSFAQKLSDTILKDMDMRIFLVVILVMVGFTVRTGLVVCARMCEIIFTLLFVVYTFIFIFALPNVNIDNLTPISFRDILPAVRSSFGSISLWVSMVFMFFFSDKFWDKKKITKMILVSFLFHLFATSQILFISIGAFGSSMVERMPYAFLSTVKQISLFSVFERFEPYLVTFWVASDFIIILIYVNIAMLILKSLFNLRETKHMNNIFLIFLYFLSLFIAKDRFETEAFNNYISIPLTFVFCFIMPVALLFIGKIRKKI